MSGMFLFFRFCFSKKKPNIRCRFKEFSERARGENLSENFNSISISLSHFKLLLKIGLDDSLVYGVLFVFKLIQMLDVVLKGNWRTCKSICGISQEIRFEHSRLKMRWRNVMRRNPPLRWKVGIKISRLSLLQVFRAGPPTGSRSFPIPAWKRVPSEVCFCLFSIRMRKKNFFSGAMSGKQISRAEREHKGGPEIKIH